MTRIAAWLRRAAARIDDGRWRLRIAGAALGLGLLFAYGEAMAAGVRAAWTGAVLPAFLALGASGISLCG